jgi:hypothetical protein
MSRSVYRLSWMLLLFFEVFLLGLAAMLWTSLPVLGRALAFAGMTLAAYWPTLRNVVRIEVDEEFITFYDWRGNRYLQIAKADVRGVDCVLGADGYGYRILTTRGKYHLFTYYEGTSELKRWLRELGEENRAALAQVSQLPVKPLECPPEL